MVSYKIEVKDGIDVPEEKKLEFFVRGGDDTVMNLLKTELLTYEDVDFVSYNHSNYLRDPYMHLRLKPDSKRTPMKAVSDALGNIVDNLKEIREKLKVALK